MSIESSTLNQATFENINPQERALLDVLLKENVLRASPQQLRELSRGLRAGDTSSPLTQALLTIVDTLHTNSTARARQDSTATPAQTPLAPDLGQPVEASVENKTLESQSAGQGELVRKVFEKALGREIQGDKQPGEVTEMAGSVEKLSLAVAEHRQRIAHLPSLAAIENVTRIPYSSETKSDYVMDIPTARGTPGREIHAKTLAARFIASGIPKKTQQLLHEVLTRGQEGADPAAYSLGPSRRGERKDTFPREIGERVSVFLKKETGGDSDAATRFSEFLATQREEDVRSLAEKFGSNPIPGFAGCDPEFVADIMKNACEVVWQKAIADEERRFNTGLVDLQARSRVTSNNDFTGHLFTGVSRGNLELHGDPLPPLDQITSTSLLQIADGKRGVDTQALAGATKEMQIAMAIDLVLHLKKQHGNLDAKDNFIKEVSSIGFANARAHSIRGTEQSNQRLELEHFWLTPDGLERSEPNTERLEVTLSTSGDAKITWPLALVTAIKSNTGRPLSGGASIYSTHTVETISGWFSRLADTVGIQEAIHGVEQLSNEVDPKHRDNPFAVLAKYMYERIGKDGREEGRQKNLNALWELSDVARTYAIEGQKISQYDYEKSNPLTRYRLAPLVLQSENPLPYMGSLTFLSVLAAPGAPRSREDLNRMVESGQDLMNNFLAVFKRQLDTDSISHEELFAHIREFGRYGYSFVGFLANSPNLAQDKDTGKSYAKLAEWTLSYFEVLKTCASKVGQNEEFSKQFNTQKGQLNGVFAALKDRALSARFEALARA